MKLLTEDGRSLNPVWGSRYIAYDRERMRHLSPEYQIWLASSSGARLRRVTHIAVDSLAQGLVPIAFSSDGSGLLAQFEGQDTSEAWAVNVASGRARRLAVRGEPVTGAGISSDGRTVLVDENRSRGRLQAAVWSRFPSPAGPRRSWSRMARRPAGTADPAHCSLLAWLTSPLARRGLGCWARGR